MRPLHFLAGAAGLAAVLAVAVFVLSDDSSGEGELTGAARERGGLAPLVAGEGAADGGLRAEANVLRGSGASAELLAPDASRAGRASSGRVVRDRDGVGVPNLALRLSTQHPLRAQLRGWNLRSEMLGRFVPGLDDALKAKGSAGFGELAKVRTDDGGRFAVPGDHEGWFVSIDDPFYYLVRTSEPIFGRREEVLEVALGGRIAGKVALPEKPQKPALALLSSSGGGGDFFGGRGGRGGGPFRQGGFDPSQMMRGAELDAEGAFAFDGLPAGEGSRYQVWIVAPGISTFAAPPVDVQPGVEQRVDLALDPGIEVRGLVRDRSGAPIRNAQVRIAYEGPASEPEAAGGERGGRNEGGRGGRGGRGENAPSDFGGRGGFGGFTRMLATAESFLEATTDASGVFVLRGLGDGAYRGEFVAAGYVPQMDKRFQVRFGSHDELAIELDPARRIEGFVKLADGRAVAGAVVTASEVREAEENLGFDFASMAGPGGDGGRGGMMRDLFRGMGQRVPQAVSDGRGRFEMLDVPASWKIARLDAETETGLRGGKELGAAVAGQPDVVELLVAPTASIVAELAYPEGSAPSEQVTLSLLGGEMPFPQRTEKFTWPASRVALVDVAPGEYTLLVQAKGFASASVDVVVEQPGAATEVLVALRPGAEIRGLAVESVGSRPIGGAEITVEFDFGALRDGGGRDAGMRDQLRNLRFNARTDDLGRFVIADLAAGKITLRGEHPEFPSGQGAATELKEGQIVEDYRVVFTPGGIVTGTVVDAQGAPREGATVLASIAGSGGGGGRGGRGGFGGGRPARTDASGRYRIDRLQPGEYMVALSNGGGGGRGGGEIVGSTKTVQVQPGQTVVVDFDASDEPLASLVGTLKRGDSVVRGGTARLTVSGGGRMLSARIGEDGSFRFDELPLGTHRLSFQVASADETSGEGRGRRANRGPSGGGAGVEVALEQAGETQREFTLPGGRIAGRVSAPSANLRNVRVRLLAVESSGAGREVSSAQVDRDTGAFAFESLEPGLYRLVAEPPRGGNGGPGGRNARGGAEGEPAPAAAEVLGAVSQDVELAADASRDGLELAFVAGGTLVFKVVDDQGQPVPNARVTLQGSEGATRSIEQSGGGDREGAGRVEGLAAGLYDARITARGFATTAGGSVAIAAGAEVERTFRVARGVAFSIEIVDAEGKPVPDARIEVRGDGDELLGTFPSQGGGRGGFSSGGRQLDGIYALGSYPEGRYRLVVARGASSSQQSFTVRHADGARARVSLSKDA
ncbi:MAG: carboxypeptidase regulatory-like domain-containing protein [Planctomycetes bacterium]|nr:carboxypeptidase regulatory-like domain-containing protein [Planctomycetota bacterium]